MRWISGWRHGARQLRKNKSGSAAIEFGMVIGPFLGLMFAIIEVALTYFAQFAMESGNETALRVLRTGSAQNGNMTQAQYKARVCSKLPAFMDCDNLTVDVRSFATFAEALADMPDLYDEQGARNSTPQKYCPGTSSSVILGTLYYRWNFIMNMPGLGDFTGKMGLSLANMPDGSRLMITGFATRAEPFTSTGVPPPGC